MRRNVARTARVGIDMPGTTKIGILVNDFRVDTKLLFYLDGSAHATETEYVEHIIKLAKGLADITLEKVFRSIPCANDTNFEILLHREFCFKWERKENWILDLNVGRNDLNNCIGDAVRIVAPNLKISAYNVDF